PAATAKGIAAAGGIAKLQVGEDFKAVLSPRGLVGAPGVVEPKDREAKLSLQVPGVVAKVLVREGERVSAGDALVQLSSDAEVAAAGASRAELNVMQAQLEKLLHGARAGDLEAAAGEVEAANATA